MMVRPSPGRLRALAQAVGEARSRPRIASAVKISPRCYSSAASRRGIHSASSTVRSSNTFTALLRRGLSKATQAVRIGSDTPRFTPHRLLSVLQAARFASYKIKSPLLKGAISAFRSTAQHSSSSSGYAHLSQRSVGFARGTLSGIGSRPASGSLSLSPLRGGVGLQTARKFSSGGARVFDNLIVNAPLALRLVGGEVEDKSKLAKRPVRRVGVASARRTGASLGGAKLPCNALAFAAKQKAVAASCVSEERTPTASTTKSSAESDDLEQYFQFPQLPLGHSPCETVVSMRLIDPLFDALGGRALTPSDGSRIFDSAFLLDAQTALEYEHVRYLRAKAILRVLWATGAMEEVQLGEEGWVVKVTGMGKDEVKELVGREVMFEFEAWCGFEELRGGGEESWVSSERASEEGQEGMSTPSLEGLSSSEEGGGVVSLPDEVVSGSGSSLYDSRTSL